LTVPTVLIAQTLSPADRNDENLFQSRKNGTDELKKQYPDSASAIKEEGTLAPEGSPCGWTAAPVSPLPILDQATTAVGNNLYTFAGVSGSIIASAQKFNGTTWSSIASVPVALEFPTAVSDGTSAYIINGVNGSGTSVNTLYRYNPATNTYDTLAPSSTATWNHASVYLNGKIYKIGGYVSSASTSTSSNAVEIYDIASNTWSAGAPYPVAQGWMSAFAQGNFIYVAGGVAAETGSTASLKTYRYDPATNTWDDAAIADLPNSRWGAASSVTSYNGGWVLAGGYVDGTAAANLSATVTEWNPATNTWTALPSMLSARSRMSGAVLNGAFHVIGGRSSAGGFGGTNDNQRLFCIPQDQPFLTSTIAYVSDNGTPANGVPDPGETVTVSLAIHNSGGVATGNVVGTLAASGGITNPSGPVNFGVINPGQTVTQNFTFVVPVNAQCGSQITLTFDIADGATHYSATKSFHLGVLQVAFQQNFDGVTAPALPSGWVQNQTTGTGITWTTTTTSPNSSPNAAFANDANSANAAAIESPAFAVSASGGTLSFKNHYNTETGSGTTGYDGMVLEIKIGSGAWQDILTAGGSFVSNGYNKTISTSFSSPIAGRQAWSGDSGGYLDTVVNLPAAANGQNIQFRWLMASDSSVGATGVWIDDVQVASGYLCNTTTTTAHTLFDFDGDGKSDISIFRPGASAEWWISNSSNNSTLAAQFGTTGDVPAPADYTGDGKTDMAFFRPSNATWYVLRSEDFSFYGFQFGATGDVVAPADYDGDNKADAAVFRNGTWYIVRSTDNGVTIASFGVAGDKPVAADYDGDGKADIGIYRPSGATGGEWWIQRSTAGLLAVTFGNSTDKTVVGDYTGDGKADCAFFRPSTNTWFILRSEDFSFFGFPFGDSTDALAPADYDGDGKTDAAVFRNGAWFVNKSTGGVLSTTFGNAGDQPTAGSYVR
jgi:hypothetical protein